MSLEPPYSVADRWNEPWNALAFKRWALQLRRRLLPREVTLGLVFASPKYMDTALELVDVLRSSVGIPTLAGCVSGGIICNEMEHERDAGIALGLYYLPGAQLQDLAFSSSMARDAAKSEEEGFWRRRFDPGSESINSWLVFAEPLHFDVETWINSWQRDFPGKPIYGGLSHFDPEEKQSLVVWNDSLLTNGGVAIGFAGGVCIRGLTAQGCTPVGETWTITKVKDNVLERIGNRPAFQIMEDTFNQMSNDLRVRSRGNLFIGLAVDEYQEDFGRGDFVVRNLMAANPENGQLTVGAFPRVGQTMQFQIRDGEAAATELKELVANKISENADKRVFGACLSNCAGRGWAMFGLPHHDATIIYRMIKPQAMAGFFGNGEFGPVGNRNFVHGYTSSLAVFKEV